MKIGKALATIGIVLALSGPAMALEDDNVTWDQRVECEQSCTRNSLQAWDDGYQVGYGLGLVDGKNEAMEEQRRRGK